MLSLLESTKATCHRHVTILGWLDSFENFLSDMGRCPPGMTLERTDNNMGYSPTNCTWADRKPQSNNRRVRKDAVFIEHNGVRRTLVEWASVLGINKSTLRSRIRSGQSAGEALVI
jgi:hypothetical protein